MAIISRLTREMRWVPANDFSRAQSSRPKCSSYRSLNRRGYGANEGVWRKEGTVEDDTRQDDSSGRRAKPTPQFRPPCTKLTLASKTSTKSRRTPSLQGTSTVELPGQSKIHEKEQCKSGQQNDRQRFRCGKFGRQHRRGCKRAGYEHLQVLVLRAAMGSRIRYDDALQVGARF